MTQIIYPDNQTLIFEIVSARISDTVDQRKHVVYTLQVRFVSGRGRDDVSPSVIERRYTNFLDLYNSMKKEKPTAFTDVSFPKKVLMGNFDNELIITRSTEFESLLTRISSDSNLRNTHALLDFLRNKELGEARDYLKKEEFKEAYALLENSFRLLNKVYTDRSPAVLLPLCRTFACAVSIPDIQNAVKWGELILHRYEGVSDTDLLELYIPILLTCIKVWDQAELNKDFLEQRLVSLQKQGMKIPEKLNLFDALDKIEENIIKLV